MNSTVKQSAKHKNVKGVIFAGFQPCHSRPSRYKLYTGAVGVLKRHLLLFTRSGFKTSDKEPCNTVPPQAGALDGVLKPLL